MKTRSTLFLAISFGLSVGSTAWAQDQDAGQRLYYESCAGCHGASGTGGGELATLLSIAPPDLTGLAARNDGEFPMLQVIHTIDGRSGVRAHGGPMPVFGSMFTASSATGEEDYSAVIEVRGRILSLAMYLESIQK